MSWHSLLVIVLLVAVAVWSSFRAPALAASSYPVSATDSFGNTARLATLGGDEDNDDDEDNDGDEDNDDDEDNGDEDNDGDDEDNDGDEDNDDEDNEAPLQAVAPAPTATLRPPVAAAPAQPTATPTTMPTAVATAMPTATRVPPTSTPAPVTMPTPRPAATPVTVPVQVPRQLPRTGLADLAGTLLPAAGLGGLALAGAGLYLRRRRR